MPEQRIAVRGVLSRDGRVFTARRALTKKHYPGIYELPGGWVEFGERFEDALCREFKEECRIDVRTGGLIRAGTHMLGDIHLAEAFFFVEQTDPSQPITVDPENHSETRWWTEEEFKREWTSDHPDYLAMQMAFKLL